MSRKPVPFAVTVYFIAKKTVAPSQIGYDARQLFIYDRKEHASEFHNEIELTGAFASRNLRSNVEDYETLRVESASGATLTADNALPASADFQSATPQPAAQVAVRQAAASVLLAADMLGNIRTRATRAFTTSEMEKILSKIP
jgi:hypothetical protein